MPEYTIRQGECLASIAAQSGLLWDTIWNHPKNRALKQRRDDPGVLMPGDSIFVPEKQERLENRATEKRHKFRVKGVPVKLRLRFVREEAEEKTIEPEMTSGQYPPPKDVVSEDPPVDETGPEGNPRANLRYVAEIDGIVFEGTTDDDGKLALNIPPNATQGRIILAPGTPNEEEIPLNLGHLNPITEISGIKQRLANLGYQCGDVNDEETLALGDALRTFQGRNELEVTGEVDDSTRQRILELHGD